ncbi:MAG TPA: filamentous hemagglutinin N-terminal domain-containing protein [Burkholderiales bacterium]|nr:filamentous hemagglutinin N-terminal domain-containing protein [Burkholderiales bacterium]
MTLIAAAALATCIPSAAVAQIRTDTSLGQPARNLTGPNFLIPQAFGRLSGNNLFHSFQTFNILAGEAAFFTTSTPGLANVVSRVTGGSASQINGLLMLIPAGGAPNFFFINPTGVTFGAGASIDVPGAFHVSTANYIKFPDGNFHADLNQTSTFSSAPPEAFGFLGTTRAPVTVSNGAVLAQTGSRPISIVAGDIEINNGLVATTAGDIRLAAVGAGPQEIGFTGALPAVSGNLMILDGAAVFSGAPSSNNSGSIMVGAGDITIDGRGTLSAGILTLAQPGGTGNAGSIGVSATGNLNITNGGFVSSSTSSSGNAGNIDVSATGTLSISNRGVISSDAFGFSSGNAAAIKVTAGSITIDGLANSATTGIYSNTNPSSLGRAGGIDVSATGAVSIKNGGGIFSVTRSPGDAGSIKVSGGSVAIDGQNSLAAGISSVAGPGSTGNAGGVEVSATGSIAIANGGFVASNTFSSGGAGAVKVQASDMTINTGGLVLSGAFPGSTGNAGNIDVSVTGNLSLATGAGTPRPTGILASTAASGNAGTVKISAGNIAIDGQGSDFTGIESAAELGSTGKAGSVEVLVPGNLALVNGGVISTNTFSSGDAGTIKVTAGNISIDGKGFDRSSGIFSLAALGSTGHAGSVDVSAAGDLHLSNTGVIVSSTLASGDAGSVRVSSDSIVIEGSSGIFSQAGPGNTGRAGSVEVSAGSVHLKGSSISSDTFGQGNAGTVKVNADTISIDGVGSAFKTGIVSLANPGSTGNAGSVEVSATGTLSVTNHGNISSSTLSSGNAGSVNVRAGRIAIDTLGEISSDTFGAGNAGSVKVSADNIAIDGTGRVSSLAGPGSTGNAGSVEVLATGILSVTGDGIISSSTGSAGNAGSVNASAGKIVIDTLGEISSDTFGAGNAGSVKVSAESIAIAGEGKVSSLANPGSTGNAGSVEVSATGPLSITNGGTITSSTSSAGNAGSVKVGANTLTVDGASSSINAAAEIGSSGQTGSVSVAATESITLSNGGHLSIKNNATVLDPGKLVPTTLVVSAPDIILKGAQITAASTGNVPASDVQINFTNQLSLDPSGITTSANLGNGGSITIQGGKFMLLENSQITTSVLGAAGNGGDINITVDTLIMKTGFIQANTAGQNATGGLVNINVQTLVASGGSLAVGGDVPFTFQPGVFGFNVIQAAAPTGVSGIIEITAPILDVSGSLSGLNSQVIDVGGLGRNPCEITGGSSLGQSGRGGLPPSARGLLRAEPAPGSGQAAGWTPSAASNLQLAFSSSRCF